MDINARTLRMLLAVLLHLCFAGVAAGQDMDVQTMAHRYDSLLLASLGLEPLDSLPAPGDSSGELRVHFGSVRRCPNYILRIRWTATDTTGALHLWWPGSDSSNGWRLPREWVEEMKEIVRSRYHCGTIRERAGFVTCVVESENPPHWGELLQMLGTMGLGRISKQLEIPADLDGSTIDIEMRTGGRYTRYYYVNPDPEGSDPSERAVGAIFEKLERIFAP